MIFKLASWWIHILGHIAVKIWLFHVNQNDAISHLSDTESSKSDIVHIVLELTQEMFSGLC